MQGPLANGLTLEPDSPTHGNVALRWWLRLRRIKAILRRRGQTGWKTRPNHGNTATNTKPQLSRDGSRDA